MGGVGMKENPDRPIWWRKVKGEEKQAISVFNSSKHVKKRGKNTT